MARYIKANPLVAKYLNLENDRNAVKDGNYILWQGDMLAFGPLTRLSETLANIGAIALMPHEAREEQDGTVIRPLPEATDPRFVIAAPVVDESTEIPGTEGEIPGTEGEKTTTDEPEGNPGDNAEASEGDVDETPGSDAEPETDETTDEPETTNN